MYKGDIYNLFLKGPIAPLNFEVEYPQANDVKKLKTFVMKLSSHKTVTRDQMQVFLKFKQPRQVGYYGNATAYLGLTMKAGRFYALTELGKQFVESTEEAQNTIIVSQMFGMRSLREVFIARFEKGMKLDDSDLEKLVEFDNKLGAYRKLTGDTPKRRAKSTSSWVDWIMKLSEDRAK